MSEPADPAQPRTIEIDHPLARERVTILRDLTTAVPEFRRALHELARMVLYEATRHLDTTTSPVQTPLVETTGHRVEPSPLLVPVLRAGLGMLDAAVELLPRSSVGFVGLRRNEDTLVPESYVNTLPSDLDGGPAIVLDPMLATGGSLIHTAQLLTEAGAGSIVVACALAAPEGIDAYRSAGFDGPVVAGAIDDRLDERGYIVPGLGDAGDRQFGDMA